MKLFKIPLLTLKMWCMFLIANSRFVFAWGCISAKKSVRRFRSSWLKFIPKKKKRKKHKTSFIYTVFLPRMLRFLKKKNLHASKSLTWISALLSYTFYLRTFLVFFLFTHLHLCPRVASTFSSIWYSLLNTACFKRSAHMFESYAVSCVFFPVR